MVDTMEELKNAATIQDIVSLLRVKAKEFASDPHDWYEVMFEDMAVLCDAIADRLSTVSKRCDWRFYTAMKEIYSLSFRPENSRPEYAAETIGAICTIAEKAFSSEQGRKNCDVYTDVDSAVKACHEDREYCKSPIDERRSVISFTLPESGASDGSRTEDKKGDAAAEAIKEPSRNCDVGTPVEGGKKK